MMVSLYGILFAPTVGHRLATAGLIERILHLAIKFFKQLKCSDANLWIKLIYITRNK
jgi:hypothetical protein